MRGERCAGLLFGEQATKSLRRERRLQRRLVVEVTVDRVGRHAGLAREIAQAQRLGVVAFQVGQAGLDQRLAQVAVVIGAARRGRLGAS